jgi:tripartite ATP-independent transporter DctM subunit
MGISLMVMVFIYCRNREYPITKLPTLKEWLDSFRAVFLALLNPVIILFGIVSGIFTPTEAAAVVVVYAIFLGAIVYKDLTWRLFLVELKETAKLISNVYVILGGALLFGFILARENVGSLLIHFFTITRMHPTLVLFLIVVLVLILGCFIEVTALMILLLPVILPVIDFIGVDKTYFGVVFIMAAIMGIMTPPFGLGLFIISGITGLPFNRTTKAVLPFLIPLLVTLGLVLLIPGLILIIPNLLMK